MKNSKENNNENNANSEAANKTEKEDDSEIGIEKKKLEQALKNCKLEHQVIIRLPYARHHKPLLIRSRS